MIRRFLPLTLLAATTLILAFLVEDFVREVVVVPVLYAGWFFWLTLTNLPQWTFWVLLTLVAALLAIRSLSGEKRQAVKRAEPPPSANGPVNSWMQRLTLASDQPSNKWRISRDLGRFYWETNFPEEPFHVQQYVARLSAPDTKIPVEIRNYFLAGTERPQAVHSFWFFRRPPPSPSALDLDPEIVVEFLENQLSPEHEQAEIRGSNV